MTNEDSLSASHILKSKTETEIRTAILNAKKEIAFIESMQGVDHDNDWDGPFPPSKTFETWVNGFGDRKVRLLKLGVEESERELKRRGLFA